MQVWKLYNTKTMDFHLFFCAKKAQELQVSRTKHGSKPQPRAILHLACNLKTCSGPAKTGCTPQASGSALLMLQI